MGAADGRRRRGDGRHPPQARHPLRGRSPRTCAASRRRWRRASDEVAVFASASEGFSRKNINCSIAESLERFAPVAEAARAAGLPLRGYVSCVVECPYDGPVAPEAVASVAASAARSGLLRGVARRHHRPRHAGGRRPAARPPDAHDRARPPRRAFPRHRRPGARQCRGGARLRAPDLRQRHRRPRRLPLRPRRQGQRLDRAAGRGCSPPAAGRPASTSPRWSAPRPSWPAASRRPQAGGAAR